MGSPLVVSNKPAFVRLLLANLGVLLASLILCFAFATFAADPVNEFLNRHDHNQMFWILFGSSAMIAVFGTLSRSAKSGPYHVLEFDGAGFISTQGEERQKVAWIDVIDTHYDEVTRRGVHNPERQRLRIYLRDGSGLLCRGFDSATMDTIIERFNQSTKHLPLIWCKKAKPDPEGRDTLSGTLVQVEDRGDALRHKPARLLFRIDSALYGKVSDYPRSMPATWEFWWFNTVQLPAVGEKISLCGYLSESTGMFVAAGSGYCTFYEKRLRSDA
jgi:hypothetical protein